MRKYYLLLIFYILYIFICPASAEQIIISEYSNATLQKSVTSTYGTQASPDTRFKYNVNYGEFYFYSNEVAIADWRGGSQTSSYDAVTLMIGGSTVGHGLYGYSKSGDGTKVFIQLFVSDMDFLTYTGEQYIVISGYSGASTHVQPSAEDQTMPAGQYFQKLDYAAGYGWLYSKGKHTVMKTAYWENRINYFDNGSYYYMEYDRNSVDTSKVKIIQDNGNVLVNEASLSSTDFQIANSSLSNTDWYFTVQSTYGNYHNFSIAFREISEATGTLVFDKSNYSYPDGITLTRALSGTDYDNYAYTIQVLADDAADFSSPSQIKSMEVFTDSGPLWISPDEISVSRPYFLKGVLREISKTTGAITYLYNATAYYSNPLGGTGGRISTDKSSYSDGENVIISVLTYENENYVVLQGPEDTINMGSYTPGSVQTSGFLVGPHAAGTWTAYLYEKKRAVNSTSFTVTSNTIFAEWNEKTIALGQLAYFDYLSGNASAQIRVYDGANSLVYGPATTQIGYHTGVVNTAGTNPGNYTISMLHNGSYYNDSLEVVSSDPWLRILSNQYRVGDTIQIEYYLTDPKNSFTLYDGQMTTVLTWTTKNGIVIVGERRIVNFTLSNDNEYQILVNSKIEAGQYVLGFWRVELFENVYGPPNPGANQVDIVKILPAATDTTYASEQIYDIMFSTEGLFYIFACIMILMGLKIAQHPAGGAAGGIASTAFGAFFGLVPTWILYLMVIALVVLAGISAAAYFRK